MIKGFKLALIEVCDCLSGKSFYPFLSAALLVPRFLKGLYSVMVA